MAGIRWTLLLVTLLVGVISANPRVKRVVGGDRVERGDYPFIVSLWYMGDNNYYTNSTPDLHHTCGGALLDDDWVLTSGACFDDNFLPGVSNFSLWRVYLGMGSQRKAEDEAQYREIDAVFHNERYNLTESYGDIALLRLVPLDSGSEDEDYIPIEDVDYNDDPAFPREGQLCKVIGWGQLQEEPFGQGSEYPYVGEFHITNTQNCSDIYHSDAVQAIMGPIRVDEGNICAGNPEGGVDACYGDSGSPIVCYEDDEDEDPIVVATVSTGFGCARKGYPSVNTRVSAYADWIEETIDDN